MVDRKGPALTAAVFSVVPQPILQLAPSAVVARCPCTVFVVTILLAAILITCGLLTSEDLRLDTGATALIESDGVAALSFNAFRQARLDATRRQRRLRRDGERRLQRAAQRFDFESFLYLNYAPNDGRTLMSPRTMEQIRDVERRIRALPSWQAVCDAVDPSVTWLCKSGISLANLAFPHTVDAGKWETLYCNGTGEQEVPLALALEWALAEGYADVILPAQLTQNQSELRLQQEACMDQVSDCRRLAEQGECEPFAEHESYMNELCASTCGLCDNAVDGTKLEALRSYFSFAGDAVPQAKWDTLMEELVELMQSYNEEKQVLAQGFRIYYNGRDMRAYEAKVALWQDAWLAFFATIFAFVYLAIHMQSPLVPLVGLFLVALSFPCALSIFILATGTLRLNVAICLVGLVLLCLGSNMLLVIADFWRASAREVGQGPHLVRKRLQMLYLQVQVSTSASTATTTLIFFLNMASDLRPLRELGFILGMSMAIAAIFMCTAYPVALIYIERFQQHLSDALRAPEDADGQPKKSQGSAAGRRSSMGDAMSSRISHRATAASSKTYNLLRAKTSTWLHTAVPTWTERVGAVVGGAVSRLRWPIVVAFVGFTVVALIFGWQEVRQDLNPPKLFRSGHNQFNVEEYDERFQQFDRSSFPQEAEARKRCVNLADSSAPDICSVHGCRTFGKRLGSDDSCVCLQQSVSDSASDYSCGSYSVAIRIVGRQSLHRSQVTQAAVMELLRLQFGNYSKYTFAHTGVTASSMHVGHWDSGREYLATLVTVPDVTIQVIGRGRGDKKECRLAEVCYCNVERCDGTEDHHALGNLLLAPRSKNVSWIFPTKGVTEEKGVLDEVLGQMVVRDLAAEEPGPLQLHPFLVRRAMVRDDMQAHVEVVLGLEVLDSRQLLGEGTRGNTYTFSPDFRFEDPWVQRVTLDLCYSFAPELRVTEVTCWVTGFMEWWRSRGQWPIRPEKFDVHRQVLDFVTHQPAQVMRASGMSKRGSARDFVFVSDQGRLQAMFVDVAIDLSTRGGVQALQESVAKWDAHLADYNGKVASKTSASWRAWHTCALWVRADAAKVMFASAMMRLVISLACMLVGVQLATHSLTLAVIATLTAAAAVICTIFVMATGLRWALGPIELLALTTFVGISADYCLHIAHKFHTCQFSVKEARQDESEAMTTMTSDCAPQKPRATYCSDVTDCDYLTDSVRDFETWRAEHRSEERQERAIFALKRMGATVWGSGFVTLGFTSFFLFAEFAMLMKMSLCIVLVASFATLFALVPLPAVLMLCGPSGHNYQRMKVWSRLARTIARQIRTADYEDDWDLREDGDGTEVARGRTVPRRPERGPPAYYIMRMPARGVAAVTSAGVAPAMRTPVRCRG